MFLTFDRAAEIKETVYISNNSIVNTYVCLFQNLNANTCNIFEKKQELLHFLNVVIVFFCVFCNLCTSCILFNISNFFLKVFALFQNMKLVVFIIPFYLNQIELRSRAAYILFSGLSKGLNDAQSFLGYFLSTKHFLHSSVLSITCTSVTRRLWWTEGSCSGVNIITRVAQNAKRASWLCLRNLKQELQTCGISSIATKKTSLHKPDN